jgi:hypothetical protein
MRNLSLATVNRIPLPAGGICATAIDLDDSTLYVADDWSGKHGLEIMTWKIANGEVGGKDPVGDIQ